MNRNKHGEFIATGETLEGDTFHVQVPFWFKNTLFLEVIAKPAKEHFIDKIMPISAQSTTHILVQPKPVYLHTFVVVTTFFICLISLTLAYNSAQASEGTLVPRQYVCPPCDHVESIFNTEKHLTDGQCTVCGMDLVEPPQQSSCGNPTLFVGSGSFCFKSSNNKAQFQVNTGLTNEHRYLHLRKC